MWGGHPLGAWRGGVHIDEREQPVAHANTGCQIWLFSVCKCASRSRFNRGGFMTLESAMLSSTTILLTWHWSGWRTMASNSMLTLIILLSTRRLLPTSLAKPMWPGCHTSKCFVNNSPTSASRLREAATTKSSPWHKPRYVPSDSDIPEDMGGHASSM